MLFMENPCQSYQYITNANVNSAFHLSGVQIKHWPAWLALRRGAFTCVGWQVTLYVWPHIAGDAPLLCDGFPILQNLSADNRVLPCARGNGVESVRRALHCWAYELRCRTLYATAKKMPLYFACLLLRPPPSPPYHVTAPPSCYVTSHYLATTPSLPDRMIPRIQTGARKIGLHFCDDGVRALHAGLVCGVRVIWSMARGWSWQGAVLLLLLCACVSVTSSYQSIHQSHARVCSL